MRRSKGLRVMSEGRRFSISGRGGLLLGRGAGAALLVLLASSLGAQDIGFEGPGFSGAGSTPTESKPESKLWHNDGTWWGVLWSTGNGFRIHRLNFTTHAFVHTGVAIHT